jgi:hypothetical protein
MANVPWHEEVITFVRLLCERLPQFGVACEHEHSNCLLLANTKVNERTHIYLYIYIYNDACTSSMSTINGTHGLIMNVFMN